MDSLTDSGLVYHKHTASFLASLQSLQVVELIAIGNWSVNHFNFMSTERFVFFLVCPVKNIKRKGNLEMETHSFDSLSQFLFCCCFMSRFLFYISIPKE